MQLSAIPSPAVALVVLAVVGCVDRAATTGSYHHHQDPHARVSTPGVQTTAFGEDVELNARWSADIVSGATPVMAAPDVYSRATDFEETRHEVELTGDWQQQAEQTWSAALLASAESDYDAYSASAGFAREIFDRHTTVAATGRVGLDRIGRADAPRFSRSLFTGGAAVELTQIINRELLTHLTWDFETRLGYQSNPYRRVPVYDAARSPSLVIPERHPERRLRNALESVVVWSPRDDLFLHAGYRFYFDDWGILSHTGHTRLWHTGAADRYRAAIRFRGYFQNDADFYQARYDEVQPFRTGDYRLARMNSVTGGLQFQLRPDLFEDHRPRLSMHYDTTLYRFANYAPRFSMWAHSWGLNLTMNWR